MIIENQKLRLTNDEAVLGGEGARVSGDDEAYDFLMSKSDVATEHLVEEGISLHDPVDGVPEHLHSIEFPATPDLVEKIAGYIAVGRKEDDEIKGLVERALHGTAPQRRKPEVKARHKARHLTIVK